MRTHEVVIAGGGPVGLMLAMLLGETGLAVQVVEASTTPKASDHAAILLPSSLDTLDKLSLIPSLLDAGVICQQMHETLNATGASAIFDLGLLHARTAHPYILQCEMQTLMDVLRSRLAGCPNVRLQTGAKVVGFTQTEDWVEVEIDCNGERFVDRTSILAGCDGASSVVRETLRIELEGSEGEDVLSESLPLDSAKVPDGTSPRTVLWQDGGGEVALARLPGHWRAGTVSTSPPNAAAVHDGAEVSRGRASLASRLHHGRVALAGDAAHQTRPEAEASLSASLGDAFELAISIDAIIRKRGDLALLDRFGQRRRSAARTMLAHEEAMIKRRRENRDPNIQRASFAALQALAADPDRCREHLLGRAMIEQRAEAVS